MYNDNSTDIVNEYKNAYHRTLKRKSTDVKGSICFDFGSENNEKIPKFEVAENVRISKYKEIFAKGYTPNCWKEDFVIKEVKDALQWTYATGDSKRQIIFGTFSKNNCRRHIKQSLELKN